MSRSVAASGDSSQSDSSSFSRSNLDPHSLSDSLDVPLLLIDPPDDSPAAAAEPQQFSSIGHDHSSRSGQTSSIFSHLRLLFDSHYDSIDPFRSPKLRPAAHRSFNQLCFIGFIAALLFYTIWIFYQNSQRPTVTVSSTETEAIRMNNRVFLIAVESPEYSFLTWNYADTPCEGIIKQYFNMSAQNMGFQTVIGNPFQSTYAPNSLADQIAAGLQLPSCRRPAVPNVVLVPLCFLTDEEYDSIDMCIASGESFPPCLNTIGYTSYDRRWPIQLSYSRAALLNCSHSTFSGTPARIQLTGVDFSGFSLSSEFVDLKGSLGDHYLQLTARVSDAAERFDSPGYFDRACDHYRDNVLGIDGPKLHRSATSNSQAKEVTMFPDGRIPTSLSNPLVRIRFGLAPQYHYQHSYSTQLDILTLFSAIGGSASILLLVFRIIHSQIESRFRHRVQTESNHEDQTDKRE